MKKIKAGPVTGKSGKTKIGSGERVVLPPSGFHRTRLCSFYGKPTTAARANSTKGPG